MRRVLPIHQAALSSLADRPYQTQGVEFLCRTPRALLAFDTRLGKSRTAIRAAQKLNAKRILIVAPGIARLSWPAEIDKVWSDMPRGVMQFGRSQLTPVWGTAIKRDKLIAILPYDRLSQRGPPGVPDGWLRQIMQSPRWDVLILDEAHYLKSAGANRTIAVYGHGHVEGLAHRADRVWLLTATPTPNNAGELYPHYRTLWPEALQARTQSGQPRPLDQAEFEDAFCIVEDHPPYGRRVFGSRNQESLRQALAPYVLRKRKSDVLDSLPPVQNTMVPLDVSKPVVLSDTASDEIVLGLQRGWGGDGPGVSTLRRELGESKIDATVEWVIEQLQGGLSKLVLFGWHTSVLFPIYEKLAAYSPAYIDGATKLAARSGAVLRFQQQAACRVFVGQMLAAGTAISLDAADDVAIVEPSWVPSENYQAACRVENVTKTKAVTVSWLFAPGSLDERIMRVCRVKTAELNPLWN
jgi:SWI/SNF-related matrix-associated actin-dependent regulator 1 of chromatin subfamily A